MSNTTPSKNENSSSAKLYIETSQDDDNVTPYNGKFGYGPCQPDWLQCCNSAKWLTVHVGAFVFLAGMQVTGLKAAAARPLEKQFGFTSTEIGIMAAMYDVGAAIFGFIFSFFAAHTHKGKWVATGSILMAIGSMIIASPHFIYGRYQYSAVLNVSSICNETAGSSCISGAISSSSVQLFILSLGQLISGMGSTIIWTIAFPYLDENVSPTASPIYIGVFGALASLGPGAGYLLGGAFLNFFVDWPTRPTDINSSDPQWVGAWWFGYVLSAILMAMTAVPLLAYPKHLPEYEKNKEKRAKIAIGKSVIDNNYGNSIKELPKAVKELVTNKVFLFVTLGATTEGMTVGGLSTFIPKYLQTQMNISSSRASFLSGILVVIGAASGMQLGGVVVRVKRLRPVQIAKFCYSVGIAGIFCALLILFNCSDVPIAGVTKSYLANNTSQSLTNMNLVSGCNGNCNCYISNYDPVCGIDGISYASPCYAGCSYSRINGTSKYYYSCSCISKGNTSATMASQSYDAVRELCPNNCKFFIPMLFAISLCMFITYFNAVPASQVIMRCVPESQRCFALGINWLVLRLLGSVPGPIIVGSIIDQSCILWNEQCGRRSFCWKYDNYLLSVLLTVVLVTLKTLTAVFFFLAWYFFNKQEIKSSKQKNKNLPASSKETTDTYQIQYANDSREDTPTEEKYDF